MAHAGVRGPPRNLLWGILESCPAYASPSRPSPTKLLLPTRDRLLAHHLPRIHELFEWEVLARPFSSGVLRSALALSRYSRGAEAGSLLFTKFHAFVAGYGVPDAPAPGSGWAECRMGVLPRARINDKLREETRTDRVMRSLAAWAASKLGRGDQRTVESRLQQESGLRGAGGGSRGGDGWNWRVGGMYGMCM